jgi:hypothetical protein
MADLRLIAVALVAACSDAGAQTPVTSGIKPPAGWTLQPEIAAAAKTALGKATVDGLEAFGEPAMGCYAVWMSVRGSGKAKDLAEQLVRGLVEPKPDKNEKKKPPKRTLEIKDVVKPTAEEGIFSLGFESPPYKGRLRARLGKGKITALACFASQREPATCETTCTALLGTVQ